MADLGLIVYESQQDNRIKILSLNRPKQLNAMNGDMLQELREQLDHLARNSTMGALIITSEMTRAFCSGIDMSFVQELSNTDAAQFFAMLADTLEQLIHFPAPTIAAVNGYTFGAGADLALACDLRVAGASSRFRFPGPQFGVVLGTQRLSHEVGPSRARLLALTGQIVDAREAQQYGLVHQVTEDESCLETALALAATIIRMPSYTLHTIRDICRKDEEFVESRSCANEWARKSVLEGNFHERFSQFINQARDRK